MIDYSINLHEGFQGGISGVLVVHYEWVYLSTRAKFLCFSWKERSLLMLGTGVKWPEERPPKIYPGEAGPVPKLYKVRVQGTVRKKDKDLQGDMSGAKWIIQVHRFDFLERVN